VLLVYQEAAETRSEALKREHQVKRMGKADKERMIKPRKRRTKVA
jgi:predicted GIY-YIG superfamily endonuclease